jgi:hypothetical protein
MPDTFQSRRKASGINRYFTITNTTSAGRTAHKDNLDYTLGVGGRASILLYPLYNFRVFLNFLVWKLSLAIKLQSVAVVFGVNPDKSVFVNCMKVDKNRFEGIKDDKSDLFEEYIASLSIPSQNPTKAAGVLSVLTNQDVGVQVKVSTEEIRGEVVHIVLLVDKY